MDVEFKKASGQGSTYAESRILLKLSEIIESSESEVTSRDYEMVAATKVVTSYGEKHTLLINFDEFCEMYQKMKNKTIVVAR